MSRKPRKSTGARKPSGSGSDAKGAVGYGRPPTSSQFKPGRSGNRNGRPKGRLNFKTMGIKVLLEPMQIHEGNQTRTVPVLEALLRKLRSDALRGDTKAIATLFNTARSIGLLDDATEVPEEIIIPNDSALLDDYVFRHTPHSTPALTPLKAPRRRR